MRVLIACEFSGIVRDAFAQRGHDAWSCDLLPSERNGQHIQGNVLGVLNDDWGLLIAHPPCTYLTNAGVRHLHVVSRRGNHTSCYGEARWQALREAAAFFKALWNSKIPKKAVENPIPHKYAIQLIGQRYSQLIQPYYFGHPETKATCLWLKGLPPLRPTHDVKAIMQTLPKQQQHRIHHMPPSADRSKLRSITYQGIADAMAEQWG